MTQIRPTTATTLGALTREPLFSFSRVFGAGLGASRQVLTARSCEWPLVVAWLEART